MFTDARQVREAYRCINIKDKIYRTNAKTWFNKIAKHIIKPKFVKIRIKEMINILKNVRRIG
jgi:Zn-dependent M16 (insulinase) family peptidase